MVAVMGAFFRWGIPRPVCAAPAGVVPVLVLGATATRVSITTRRRSCSSSTRARVCVCNRARLECIWMGRTRVGGVSEVHMSREEGVVMKVQ